MLARLKQQFRQTGVGRWFYGREASDRVMIAGLAVVLALVLVWLVVFKPLSDWRTIQENRYHNALALLDWLRVNEQQARASVAQNANAQAGSGARIPVITRTAQTNDLKLSRLQPEAGGAAVNVVLQDQSFNAMLAWIDQLERNNGVEVMRVTVDGEDTPGYVNAQVKLQ